MRRVGNLIEQIAEPENLRIAFYKAMRGKREKQDVRDFQSNLESNLTLIHRQILDGELEFGDYHYFKIYDPKERMICAAAFRERVIHQAIMNICDEYFESFQISNSYATRRGKGTHLAIERALENSKKKGIFLKLDIRKYFDSIDHEILKMLLRRRFKDGFLLQIFDKIIDSYTTESGKGVPIGNLTSQYFANYYLAYLDHYIKEELRVKHYVRYMDDMVLWDNDKAVLKSNLGKIDKYLGEKLKLEMKPIVLNYTEKGLPFLGYRIYPKGLRLNNRSRKRFTRKAQLFSMKLEEGEWSERDYQRHILPLIDFISKADTYSLRLSVFYKGIN